MNLAYSPIDWTNDEQQLRCIRARVLNILQGSTTLPNKEVRASDLNNTFPPASDAN
jgi:hypothetical protein